MPRRRLLSAPERASLLAVSTTEADRIHFHLNESDLGVIRQRRGAHNRLGFAVQLCLLRHPGTVLLPGEAPPQDLLRLVARQLRVDPALWPKYASCASAGRTWSSPRRGSTGASTNCACSPS
jgi:TnpA family transposase